MFNRLRKPCRSKPKNQVSIYLKCEVNLIAYYLSLCLIYLNVVGTMIRDKMRSTQLMLLGFMWILFWGNYENADYIGYLSNYGIIKYISIWELRYEFLFSLMMKLSASIGLTYTQFLSVISFIGLTLVGYTIFKFSNNAKLVLVLYFVYPFLLDIVQIRTFLSVALVFFSMSILASERDHRVLKYLVGVIAASFIHTSAAPMALLPIVLLMNGKMLFFITSAVSLMSSVMAITGSFSEAIGILVGSDKVGYLMTKTRYGWVLLISIQSLFFLLVVYSRILIAGKWSKREASFYDIVLKINILMIALFPFYFINSNFFRVYRFILLPNYVVYSYAFAKTNKRFVLLVALLFFVGAVAFWHVYLVSGENVFHPIMEKNMLFEIAR